MTPYPDWLNPGDNAWQLVAATLVGLTSIPGIAVLYGGIVQRKWAVNQDVALGGRGGSSRDGR